MHPLTRKQVDTQTISCQTKVFMDHLLYCFYCSLQSKKTHGNINTEFLLRGRLGSGHRLLSRGGMVYLNLSIPKTHRMVTNVDEPFFLRISQRTGASSLCPGRHRLGMRLKFRQFIPTIFTIRSALFIAISRFTMSTNRHFGSFVQRGVPF